MDDNNLSKFFEEFKQSLNPQKLFLTQIEKYEESARERMLEAANPSIKISEVAQELLETGVKKTAIDFQFTDNEQDRFDSLLEDSTRIPTNIGISQELSSYFKNETDRVIELSEKMSVIDIPIETIQQNWLGSFQSQYTGLLDQINGINDYSTFTKALSQNFNETLELAKSLYSPFGYDEIYTELTKTLELSEKEVEKLKKAVEIVSINGWFVDWEHIKNMDFILDVALKLSDEETVDEGNNILAKHFEDKALEIFKTAKTIDPSRLNILKATEEAYLNQNYELAIPVLFTQSDGIFFYIFKNSFFYQRGNVKGDIKKMSNGYDYLNAFIALVINYNAIEWSPNSRADKKYTGLNRHKVLHGECTDYPTRENSLRAISILNYVCQLSDQWGKYKDSL